MHQIIMTVFNDISTKSFYFSKKYLLIFLYVKIYFDYRLLCWINKVISIFISNLFKEKNSWLILFYKDLWNMNIFVWFGSLSGKYIFGSLCIGHLNDYPNKGFNIPYSACEANPQSNFLQCKTLKHKLKY